MSNPVWLIERVSSIGYSGPTEYYTGEPIEHDQYIEFPSTQAAHEAAMWQNKEAAEKVAKKMLGGKAYYWEVNEHIFYAFRGKNDE